MLFNFNAGRKYLLSIVIFFFASHTNATTLTWEGSQLTGVTGIDVLNETWDVSFIDASYTAAYADTGPTFLGSESDAHTANAALAAVLIANWDQIDDPSDINGCELHLLDCRIATPYLLDLALQTAHTWATSLNELGDVTATPRLLTSTETNFATIAFTRWEMSTVPEPSIFWLLSTGLLGLIGLARLKVNA